MGNGDIGLIGLAVMGQNLVMNMNDHGYSVYVYNRSFEKTKAFIEGPAAGRSGILATESIEELCAGLKRPRKIMLMVKAGEVVDIFIEKLLPYLEKGDVIIDGGNSHFPDSNRRARELAEKGILFVGSGVSGGEEGARFGPSLMPGGHKEAWPLIQKIFQDIAAKTDDGEACCDWVGEDGAGHYVKMVHNGIEYGDMQLIAESYALMKSILGLSHDRMAEVYETWNSGPLDSYLIEITAEIMQVKDSDGSALVTKILDAAGQKGTGKWTGISALDLGMPLTLIGEAVFARCISALKNERVKASELFNSPEPEGSIDEEQFLKDLELTLLASKIISYAQGFMLMKEAAKEFNWKLNYGGIALMWRGGCIIRSAFLGKIKDAYDTNPQLENLVMDDYFRDILNNAAPAWRRIAAKAVEYGIAIPAIGSALSFFDGYRSKTLPANLIQAQRDYFGAHTYERIDRNRGEFFHTNWTGTGGDVSSSTYFV
jgi:6-phosphogluconate dehydrogenase